MADALVTLAEIEAARRCLSGVIRPTPAEHSHSLSRRFGLPVWLKPEHRQRTGSFKIRGAYHLQSSLPAGAAVVAGSAGNHAQGVALAASLLGQQATIYMPQNASLPKLQATRSYGAEVVLDGDTVDDCVAAARAHAERTGAAFVPPFEDRAVIAGQGTIGLELLEEVPGVASVVVAVGGGGLCGGIAAAVKQRREDVRVVGVAAAGAASVVASLREGAPVPVAPHTVADGIALRAPGEQTLAHIAAFVDDVATVPDELISQAVLLLVERTKSVVEPAGAVPLAALLEHIDLPDGPTALVLGGGNVDPLLLTKLVEHGLSVGGRFLVVRVVMPDVPGSLARLTRHVAGLGLNVLDVEHHRSGLRLQLGAVEVQLTVETRDHEHRAEVLRRLAADGFEVELVE